MFSRILTENACIEDLMGCTPSGPFREKTKNAYGKHHGLVEWLENLQFSGDPYNMLVAYIKMEKDILNRENQSPVAKLNVATSRLQYIKSLIQSSTEKEDKQEGRTSQESSIYELFVDLGLHRGSSVAAEHEEFIASFNRNALNLNFLAILERGSILLEENIRESANQVNRLQILYEKQDMLLGRIYGGAYGSEREKLLEEELNILRNYRDAFFGVTCDWEFAATNARNAAELMSRGIAAWRSVRNSIHVERKISMATEARNAIQEAIVLIETSNHSIPAVQFPYCTKRELTSVSQAIEYIFTDMLIEDRYSHAAQVFRNLQERATALWQWINQILNSSLKTDLMDMDRGILDISKNLRNERIGIICERLGIKKNYALFGLNPVASTIFPAMTGKTAADGIGENGALPIAQRKYPNNVDNLRKGMGRVFDIGIDGKALTDHDWHGEFERKLIDQRSAMWPSRRIEELRTLLSNPRVLSS